MVTIQLKQVRFNYFQTMIKNFIILLLSVICNSCGFFVEPKGTFVVKNNSSYKIEITIFYESKVIERVEINSNDEFKKTMQVDWGSTTTPFNGPTDSVIVQFDNLRYIKQYCQGFPIYGNFDKCDFKKNLIDFETGVTTRNKLTGYNTKTITFDNSDFEKAIPL